MTEQTIPVVDLEVWRSGDRAARAAFVAALGGALVEYGFVAVENHGVDRGSVGDSYARVAEFFALPAEVKRRYELAGRAGQRGYVSFGTEHAKDRAVHDLKEFWHVGPELAADHALVDRMPANVWPVEVDDFKRATLSLWSELHGCGAILLRAIARYLGADEDAFARMIDGGNTVLRLIRYPGPDEVEAPPDAVWAAAHEDINLITLLVEATEPGLELLRRDGTWMPVAPIPGQLIADSGDMLQRLTNGLIPATTHRVVAPPRADGPRFSMPFFIHPHPDYVLSPLEGTVTSERPRRWADCTADVYLHERLREIGLAPDE